MKKFLAILIFLSSSFLIVLSYPNLVSAQQVCNNQVRTSQVCTPLVTQDQCGNAMCSCEYQGTDQNGVACIINKDQPCSANPIQCNASKPTCDATALSIPGAQNCGGRIISGTTYQNNSPCGGGSYCTGLDSNGCGRCEGWSEPSCQGGTCVEIACQSLSNPYCGKASNACQAPGFPGCQVFQPPIPTLRAFDYTSGTYQTGSVNVSYVQNIILDWSVTNTATSCDASSSSGTWGGGKNPTGGNENIGTHSTGSYDFFITCTNSSSGLSGQAHVTVNVGSPPPPPSTARYLCSGTACIRDDVNGTTTSSICDIDGDNNTDCTSPIPVPTSCGVSANCSGSTCTFNTSYTVNGVPQSDYQINIYPDSNNRGVSSGWTSNSPAVTHTYTTPPNTYTAELNARMNDGSNQAPPCTTSINIGTGGITPPPPPPPGGYCSDCPGTPACGTFIQCQDSSGNTCTEYGAACNGSNSIMVRLWNADAVTPYNGPADIKLLSNFWKGADEQHNFYIYPPGVFHDANDNTGITLDRCMVPPSYNNPNHLYADPGLAIRGNATVDGCFDTYWSKGQPLRCSPPGPSYKYQCDDVPSSCGSNGSCNQCNGFQNCNQNGSFYCGLDDKNYNTYECECFPDPVCESDFRTDSNICIDTVRGVPEQYPVCFPPNRIPITINKNNPIFMQQEFGTFNDLRNIFNYNFAFAAPYGYKLKVLGICGANLGCTEYNTWVLNPTSYPNRGTVLKDWNTLRRSDNPEIQANYWSTDAERVDPNTFHVVLDVLVSSTSQVLTNPTSVCDLNTLQPKISLSWSPTGGVSQYQVYRSDAGGAFQLVQTLPGSQFNYVDPTTGQNTTPPLSSTAYSYFVRVIQSSGLVVDSNIVSITTPACSANPPSNLNATCGCNGANNQAVLSWNPVSGAASYEVWKGGSAYSGLISSTNFTDNSGLVANGNYNYNVRACNSSGTTCSALSNTANVTCPYCDPNPPQIALVSGIPACVVPDHLAGAGANTLNLWNDRPVGSPTHREVVVNAKDVGGSGIKRVLFTLRNTSGTDIYPPFSVVPNTSNSSGVTASFSSGTIYDGDYNFNIDDNELTSVTPPNNDYILSYQAEDNAGNSSTTGTIQFKTDATCKCPYIRTKEGDVHSNQNIDVCP